MNEELVRSRPNAGPDIDESLKPKPQRGGHMSAQGAAT